MVVSLEPPSPHRPSLPYSLVAGSEAVQFSQLKPNSCFILLLPGKDTLQDLGDSSQSIKNTKPLPEVPVTASSSPPLNHRALVSLPEMGSAAFGADDAKGLKASKPLFHHIFDHVKSTVPPSATLQSHPMSRYGGARECSSARSRLLGSRVPCVLNTGPMGDSLPAPPHTPHPCGLVCSLSCLPISWRGGPPQLLLHMTSSCIHLRNWFMERRGESSHMQKTHSLPRDAPTEGHWALVERTGAQECLEENVSCEHPTGTSSPWPHHRESSSSHGPRAGGHGTHTQRKESTHAHTVDPEVGEGLRQRREHHGGLQELHLWEWI